MHIALKEWEIVLRLLFALAAGGIIGYERSTKGIDAGFRTHIIVCLSSCSIMLTNLQILAQYGVGDPTRMPAQVISGVGFLGAGCILVTRQHRIKGVTTAAGVWSAACLGLCIGAGNYIVAGFVLGAVFISLTFFSVVDDHLFRKTKYVRLYAELESPSALTGFIRYLHEQGIKIADIESIDSKFSDNIVLILNLHLSKPDLVQKRYAEFRQVEGVVYISGL